MQENRYLHDELNGTNKVHEELFDHVFLFFGHLIQTVFSAAIGDLLCRQTLAGIGIEQFLRNRFSRHARTSLLFILKFSVFTLKFFNQSINVLYLIVVLHSRRFLIVAPCPVILALAVVIIDITTTMRMCILTESAMGNVGSQAIWRLRRRRRLYLTMCHIVGDFSTWRQTLAD